MIRLKIMLQGKPILTSWRHLPRVGELIRINGELYRVTDIVHDMDEMMYNRAYDVIIYVEKEAQGK